MAKNPNTKELSIDFNADIRERILKNALIPITKSLSDNAYPNDTKFPNGIFVWESVAITNYRIRALREENGLLQAEMARVLNMSQREYWRHEQLDYSMSLTTLSRIAIFFNVSIDWLLGASADRKPLLDVEKTYVHGYCLQDMKEAKAQGKPYKPNVTED